MHILSIDFIDHINHRADIRNGEPIEKRIILLVSNGIVKTTNHRHIEVVRIYKEEQGRLSLLGAWVVEEQKCSINYTTFDKYVNTIDARNSVVMSVGKFITNKFGYEMKPIEERTLLHRNDVCLFDIVQEGCTSFMPHSGKIEATLPQRL